jgi:hypothetical protein
VGDGVGSGVVPAGGCSSSSASSFAPSAGADDGADNGADDGADDVAEPVPAVEAVRVASSAPQAVSSSAPAISAGTRVERYIGNLLRGGRRRRTQQVSGSPGISC